MGFVQVDEHTVRKYFQQTTELQRRVDAMEPMFQEWKKFADEREAAKAAYEAELAARPDAGKLEPAQPVATPTARPAVEPPEVTAPIGAPLDTSNFTPATKTPPSTETTPKVEG